MKHIPEVIDCYQDIDKALSYARDIGLNIKKGLFHNPWIPDDLVLDYDKVEVRYEWTAGDKSAKQVSIIIPTYNRRDYLKVCLLSLFDQDFPKNKYEIIIVDDGSNDDTLGIIKKLKPTCNLKYIYWPRKKPYVFGEPGNRAGPARNLGARYARGRYLLFWDSDMVASSDLLDEHMKEAGNSVLLGIRKNLKKRAVDKDKITQRIYNSEISFKEADIAKAERIDATIKNIDYDVSSYRYPWALVTSNNLLLEKKVFDEIGGFSQDFVFWGDEDQELGYRLLQKGYKIRVNKNAVGFHQFHEQESLDEQTFFQTKHVHKNIFYNLYLDGCVYDAFSRFFNVNKSLHKQDSTIVNINITNQCNLKCSMCFDAPDARKAKKEFTFERLKEIFQEIRSLGIKRVNLSGGEPTLHKDLFVVIESGIKTGLSVSMNTNGCFSEETARRLAWAGLSKIVFSLNSSTAGLHDEITGVPGSYDRCMSNLLLIKEIIKKNKSKTKIYVQFVLMSKNLSDLRDFVIQMERIKVEGILMQAYNPFEGVVKGSEINKRIKPHLVDNGIWISQESYPELDCAIDFLIQKKEKTGIILNAHSYLRNLKTYFRKPSLSQMGLTCMAGSNFGIDSDGRVVPCWGVDWDVGNVKDKTLKEIMISKGYSKAKKVMQNCDIPCLLLCYKR